VSIRKSVDDCGGNGHAAIHTSSSVGADMVSARAIGATAGVGPVAGRRCLSRANDLRIAVRITGSPTSPLATIVA